MKAALPILAAALLAGCSGRGGGMAADDPKAAAKQGAPSNLVVLTAQAQTAAGVETRAAFERQLPETIRASARLTTDENRTWRVGAITEGRVAQVLAAPGDPVEAGRLLALIHSHEVHDARAQYRNAQAELRRAKANYQYALKARDRARRLYELKAGSLEQMERTETELRNSEAATATARNEAARTERHLVEFLGVGTGESNASTDDLIPVRAPASGTLLRRNITPGTVVTPSSDLFVLSDLSSIWAIAEVNQDYLPRLREGMPAQVFVQAWPEEPFHGRIGHIGESLDAATRTVQVRVNLPNRARRLKPEMYATAEIALGIGKAAVFVPEDSLQEIRGQQVVFVRTGTDRFEVRPVEIGRKLNGALEIRRGVRAGELVATKGTFILKSEYLKAALQGD